MSPALSSIAAVTLISLISLSGVVLLGFGERFIRKWMMIFVSFSTGAIFGNVLLHMLPEMAENHDTFRRSMVIMLCGIIVSFILEKIIHWHHCHSVDHQHTHDHVHPVGILALIGDGIHNIVDGVLIASTFYVSTPLGIATTIAVALHEIPQEIGDFSILLHSGFRRATALLVNLLTGLTAVLGAVLVIVLQGTVPDISVWILPFAAGNLLYIAGVDLLPELHKDVRMRQAILQLIGFTAGIGLLYALSVSVAHEDPDTAALANPEYHAYSAERHG